jgi:thioredoxin reductase (NADPH)
MEDFDVVVLGAGVAGLVAGATAGRHGLRVVVVDQLGVGGQILNVVSVEDYPGILEGIPGFELGPLLHAQAEAADAEFRLDTVTAIEPIGDLWVARGAQDSYAAPALIVASGSTARPLAVPGAHSLLGRGVSHCASCDGPLHAGRDVCVIGGGDSAVQEAITLADHAARVTVVFEDARLGAQRVLQTKLAARANVDLRPATRVQEIVGEGAVTAIRLECLSDGSTTTLDVSGVFVYVGLDPSSSLVGGLVDLDPGGHIEVDLMMQTSRPGLFAAGDVRSRSASQLASAAGDGATAAVGVFRYLMARDGGSRDAPLG